jgi:hypothetical protein
MRKISTFALSAALACSGGVAWADSPHFISATDSIDSTGALTFSWKEAGLGTAKEISYRFGATGTDGTCACVAGHGKNCVASENHTASVSLIGTATLPITKPGQITEPGISVGPPGCESSKLACTGQQTLVLEKITYTGIFLRDTSNGVDASVPTTQTATLFTCPK